jgi:acetyl coenzyme A synthetase (ADP forming)-like protein
MLNKLITPASIALIGASASPEKIGYQILDNLIKNNFAGEISPINPKGGEILGKKVYTSVLDVPSNIDLAIICIPSKFAAEVLTECAKKGVGSVIVITAGFSENGEEGIRLQAEITEICQKSGISMLGPNCLGLINTDINLNASFANGMPNRGNISFLSQSGAMVSALIDWSKTTSVGFSKIFSLGNKAVLKEADLLRYLYDDDSTKVVISYLEQLTVSAELTQVLAENAKKKPTIVLFGGKTTAGAHAAASHTGSLVSSYLAVETYLRQAGVIIADDLEDLFIYATLFSTYNKMNGNRVAIITNAGGPSIAASDAIVKYGLQLASISEETKEKLRASLRPEAPLGNPIDVLGDASDLEYKSAMEIIAADTTIDALLILLTPQSSTKVNSTAQHIANLQTDKPVISAFIGGQSVESGSLIIERAKKICFTYPEMGVKALSALVEFSAEKPGILIPDTREEIFNTEEKNHLLAKFNLPILEYSEVKDKTTLVAATLKIGYPVVLKTAKVDVSHKSDAGGVKLNIKNEEELLSAFAEVGTPAIVGKMVKGKHEIFLGIKKDANIGTVIAFGTGGIYSEIYKDLSYRIAPISMETAKEMINETKMGAILAGARSQKKYDIDKIAEIIVNTAKFADNFTNITEIDFNPMIADEGGDFYLVDARIILNK